MDSGVGYYYFGAFRPLFKERGHMVMEFEPGNINSLGRGRSSYSFMFFRLLYHKDVHGRQAGVRYGSMEGKTASSLCISVGMVRGLGRQ